MWQCWFLEIKTKLKLDSRNSLRSRRFLFLYTGQRSSPVLKHLCLSNIFCILFKICVFYSTLLLLVSYLSTFFGSCCCYFLDKIEIQARDSGPYLSYKLKITSRLYSVGWAHSMKLQNSFSSLNRSFSRLKLELGTDRTFSLEFVLRLLLCELFEFDAHGLTWAGLSWPAKRSWTRRTELKWTDLAYRAYFTSKMLGSFSMMLIIILSKYILSSSCSFFDFSRSLDSFSIFSL